MEGLVLRKKKYRKTPRVTPKRGRLSPKLATSEGARLLSPHPSVTRHPCPVRLTHQVVSLPEAGGARGCPAVQRALPAAHGELACGAGRHQEALGIKRAGGEQRPGVIYGWRTLEHRQDPGNLRGDGGSGRGRCCLGTPGPHPQPSWKHLRCTPPLVDQWWTPSSAIFWVNHITTLLRVVVGQGCRSYHRGGCRRMVK